MSIQSDHDRGAHGQLELATDAGLIEAARVTLRKGLFKDLLARMLRVEVVIIYVALPILLAGRYFLVKNGAGHTTIGYAWLVVAALAGAALLIYVLRWTQFFAHAALVGERDLRALQSRLRAGKLVLPARLDPETLRIGSGSGAVDHGWRSFDVLYRAPSAWVLLAYGRVALPLSPATLPAEAQAFILEKLYGRVR